MDAALSILEAVLLGAAAPLAVFTLPVTILLRTSRRPCTRCGRPARNPDGRGRCLFCRAAEDEAVAREPGPGATLVWIGCAFIGLTGIVAVLALAIGSSLVDNEVPAAVAHPTGLVMVLIYAYVLPKRFAGGGAGFLSVWTANWWRELEGPDLAAARRAAGRPGRLRRGPHALTWTDWPGYDLDQVDRSIAAIGEEFAKLTGFPADPPRGLRVICFQEEAAFVRYLRALYPDLGRMGGCATGPFHRRLVVRAPDRYMAPASFDHFQTHELTHAYLHHRLRRPPRWLDEGLATHLAGRLAPIGPAPGASYRRTEASRGRGDLIDGEALLKVGAYRLIGYLRDDLNPRSYRRIRDFYEQSSLLVDRMGAAPRDALPRFLSGFAQRRDGIPAWFKECFLATPDEVLNAARIELEDAPPEPPPSDVRIWIETELASRIADPGAPAGERRLAARAMGTSGYPWKADTLIEVLARKGDPIRAEAICSLQDLSGQLRGADPDSWREWLRTLPAEARAER